LLVGVISSGGGLIPAAAGIGRHFGLRILHLRARPERPRIADSTLARPGRGAAAGRAPGHCGDLERRVPLVASAGNADLVLESIGLKL